VLFSQSANLVLQPRFMAIHLGAKLHAVKTWPSTWWVVKAV
jgi:hypothetical protein